MSAVLGKLAVHVDTIYFEWKACILHIIIEVLRTRTVPYFLLDANCKKIFVQATTAYKRLMWKKICSHMPAHAYGIAEEIVCYVRRSTAQCTCTCAWRWSGKIPVDFVWLDLSNDKHTKSCIKFYGKFAVALSNRSNKKRNNSRVSSYGSKFDETGAPRG